ncbi:hypothetical protein GD416_27540 [Burkholderia sp. BE24]|uniref:hypothetical protein n=1 Tax=Burkholderia TaxID=32008 RepID=UPI00041E78FE|nr:MULTISPECIES: hypothetical protein [Burkholderia]MPV60073.1 hypothetical protein [Burkholderia sp. BE24]
MNDRTPVRINCGSDAFPYIEIGADTAFVRADVGTDVLCVQADRHVGSHDPWEISKYGRRASRELTRDRQALHR